MDLARQLWGDSTVTRFICASGAFSEEEIAARLQTECTNGERHGIQYWPVFELATGRLAGCCGLRPFGETAGEVEFGVHLLPDFWGSGLATEAGKAVMAYAVDTLGVSAIFAGHHPKNDASRHMLTKLGFTYLGDRFYAPTGLMHPGYCYRPDRG